MGKRTALYDAHIHAQAKIVDFAGWDMPLHYGSQIQEHLLVRKDAGLFDVSHMTIVDCSGPGVIAFLRYTFANDVGKLNPGQALYTCMLKPSGGIIDDLIIYQLAPEQYRLVVNSATRSKDLAWLNEQVLTFDCELCERDDLGIIAIQGPATLTKLQSILTTDEYTQLAQLQPFHCQQLRGWLWCRTGYTGEYGFEVMLPNAIAADFWQQVIAADIKPCGLGARDTLRLEAGLNLYGADMDENVTPLESNLTWTVAMEPAERDFIGRAALSAQLAAGVQQQLVGLVLSAAGVLRNHQKVQLADGGEGEITSGSFSPSLAKGIALARLPKTIAHECSVAIRGKLIKAQIIKPPFLRQGKKTF
jgi:aminomethyltransferase